MDSRDMLDLPPAQIGTEATLYKWQAGSTQEVAWAITANHGGTYSPRYIKKSC